MTLHNYNTNEKYYQRNRLWLLEQLRNIYLIFGLCICASSVGLNLLLICYVSMCAIQLLTNAAAAASTAYI